MSSCGVTASTDGVGHSGLSSGLLLVDEVELDEEELVSAVEWIAMGVPSKINALRTTVVTSEKNLFIVAHPFFISLSYNKLSEKTMSFHVRKNYMKRQAAIRGASITIREDA